MTPAPPSLDLATQWKLACQLYPVYFEIAREFVIDVEQCPALEAGGAMPDEDGVRQASQWIAELEARVQVHQLRQYVQTSSHVSQDNLVALLQYFLAQPSKSEAMRDKVDFLLVQYFSQLAPAQLDDSQVDLAYVAHALDSVLGSADPKSPVWLNSLDRVLESARHCRSLDELLHSGVLDQGRKAKAQAGDLFFLPVALAGFTRYGYLMRRVFFRLMHGDLNAILDGLDELEAKGVETIDCRRAQFSEQEPVMRLRMICQSWKVLFQAEYSSGQPMRMLVDLRASVDEAAGRSQEASLRPAKKPATNPSKPSASAPTGEKAEGAAASIGGGTKRTTAEPTARFAPANDAPEFEVTSSGNWDAEDQPPKKK